MKKLSIFFATVLAVLGMSSCSQDTDPKYKDPTSFVLNQPVFTNQYYQCQEGNTFYLFCSQPDYGYSAVTNYAIQVALTPDFASVVDVDGNVLPDTITLDNGVKVPTYVEIMSNEKYNAQMSFKDEDLALAICTLKGIQTEDDMAEITEPVKVYVRAKAWLSQVESSLIYSNAVSLNKVMPFFAVPQPGFIYLVGQPEGWAGPSAGNAAHYEPWRLFEKGDAIGSGVYYGSFYIPEGEAMFRFYTALDGWGDDGCPWCLGYIAQDNATDLELVDNTFSSNLVYGKGSLNFPGWPGGMMDIMVDMSTSTPMVVITARPGESDEGELQD